MATQLRGGSHVFLFVLFSRVTLHCWLLMHRLALLLCPLQVYPKITDLNASVEDPRIMGVIREQGGKVSTAYFVWPSSLSESL